MNKFTSGLVAILKGLLAGITAIVILYAGFSILMSTFESPNKYTYPATLVGLIISVPIAGYAAVLFSRQKKASVGCWCGLLYIIILYIISSVMNKDLSVGYNTLFLLVIGAAAGTIGGILCINRMDHKRAKRNRTFIGKTNAKKPA
jgi:putative membrane protein (TIGR04086 family)